VIRIDREGAGVELEQTVQSVLDALEKTSQDNHSEKLSEKSRIREKADFLLEALEARGFFNHPGDPGTLQEPIQMYESIVDPEAS
jgi:hypothetical protein